MRSQRNGGTPRQLEDIANLPRRLTSIHEKTYLALQDVELEIGRRSDINRISVRDLARYIADELTTDEAPQVTSFQVIGERPGTTGTTHPIKLPILADVQVVPYLNGDLMTLSPTLTSNDEFRVVNGEIETNRSLVAVDLLEVDYVADLANTGGVYTERLTTTGTDHVLAFLPRIGVVNLYLNGNLLADADYVVDGQAITTDANVLATDKLIAEYQIDTSVQLKLRETVTSTGTDHALRNRPSSALAVGLFLNGDRMERDGTGQMGFTVDAFGQITTVRNITNDDDFYAKYTIPFTG